MDKRFPILAPSGFHLLIIKIVVFPGDEIREEVSVFFNLDLYWLTVNLIPKGREAVCRFQNE